jgi:hypothetical protein
VAEIFPVLAGLICGLVLGGLTARRRIVVGVGVSIVAGLLATVLSGEWRVSWAFLLIDIPLVAVSAVVGDLVSRTAVVRRTSR